MCLNKILIICIVSICSYGSGTVANRSYSWLPGENIEGSLTEFHFKWKSLLADKRSGHGIDIKWQPVLSHSNVAIKTYHDNQTDVVPSFNSNEISPVCVKASFKSTFYYKTLLEVDQVNSGYYDVEDDAIFFYEFLPLEQNGVVLETPILEFDNNESFIQSSWDYKTSKFRKPLKYLAESNIFNYKIEHGYDLSFEVENLEVVYDVTSAKTSYYNGKAKEKIKIMRTLVEDLSRALFSLYYSNHHKDEAFRSKLSDRLGESNLVESLKIVDGLYSKLISKVREKLEVVESTDWREVELEKRYHEIVYKYDDRVKATGSNDKRYQNLNDIVYNLVDIQNKIKREKNYMSYLRTVRCNVKNRSSMQPELKITTNDYNQNLSTYDNFVIQGESDFLTGNVTATYRGKEYTSKITDGKFEFVFSKYDIEKGINTFVIEDDFGNKITKRYNLNIYALSGGTSLHYTRTSY